MGVCVSQGNSPSARKGPEAMNGDHVMQRGGGGGPARPRARGLKLCKAGGNGAPDGKVKATGLT